MRFTIAVLHILVCVGAADAGGIVPVSWVGPGSGVWNAAENWDPSVIPNNNSRTAYDVLIDAGGAFDVELNTIAIINALTIGSDDTLAIPNAQSLTLETGPLVNNGTISLSAQTEITSIGLGDAVVSFEGTGAVELGQGDRNEIRRSGSMLPRLHNGVNHTIRGGGRVGRGQIFLTNDGVIDATESLGLELHLATWPEININRGTLQASDGGMLTIETDGTIDNTEGVIRALHDSEVRLNGGVYVGGTLESVGSGALGTVSSRATLQDLTLNGPFYVHSSQGTVFRGTVTNNGSIVLVGENVLIAGPTQTFAGSGVLDLGTCGSCSVIAEDDAETELTNGVDHTIRGGGLLGQSTLNIVNDGTIRSDTSPPQLTISVSDNFINNGLLHAADEGRILFGGGIFENSGQVLIDANSTFICVPDCIQLGGVTTVNGTFRSGNGTLLLQGGTLMGNGEVDAIVVNEGGTINPGVSPGQLVVVNDFAQSSQGRYLCEIYSIGNPGNHYDHILVEGNATVGGTLELVSISEYQPTIGDTFTVLTAASVSGAFDRIEPCGIFQATYTPTSVIVEVVSEGASCAGDHVTSDTFQPPPDGIIDGADLAFLLGEWGAGPSCADVVTSATFQPPPDGVVDGADLAVLLGAWGNCP